MRRPREGRALTPSEQLRVLARAWRNDRDGYVFLPWISGESRTKAQRRKNYHEGRAFLWPDERGAILAHLQAHQSDDLYFCPNLFNGKRRQEELVYAEMSLYADLDAVDPRELPVARRPTLAWESSPGRYQGIWLLSGMREGATWPGGENQRLTYELGADLSGWDATQLLRVPGKPNYKPEYVEARGGSPAPGVLLWDNGPRYQWDDFDDLPEIGVVGDADSDLVDEEMIRGIDRHGVVARVRTRISKRVKELLAARATTDVDGADRSDILWEICRELADAGCTLAEIVAVTRPSVWNKYRGRNDELRRLKTEAAKALAEVRDGEVDGSGAITFETPKPQDLISVSDVWARGVPRPRWLIRGIWTAGGCGFVAGEPKTYKSWLALDLAVSLATGRPFLGQFAVVGGPHEVLYLQEEDAESLVVDRFSAVVDGKDASLHPGGALGVTHGRAGQVWWGPPRRAMPLWLHVRTGFTSSDEAWQEWLDEKLGSRDGRIKAVVIDTMSTTAGSVDVDKSSEMNPRILRPLREIAGRHGAAVVMVHHNRKSGNGEGRAGKDMLGSQALHAWVDCALYVRDRDEVDRVPGLSLEALAAAGSDGGDGKTRYLGVPGVEIRIEREAKAAEEIRFRVGIPRMVRDTGDRWSGDGSEALRAADRWMPQVVMGWRKEVEGENERGRRADGERKSRRPGQLIVEQIAEMGVTVTRGKTTTEISEIKDVVPRTVQKQLAAAERSGWVRRDDQGRWYLSAVTAAAPDADEESD